MKYLLINSNVQLGPNGPRTKEALADALAAAHSQAAGQRCKLVSHALTVYPNGHNLLTVIFKLKNPK